MQPLVSFVAPIYKYYPIVLSSLITQEYQNWQLVLVHDDPDEDMEKTLFKFQEPRVRCIYTEERTGGWGHPIRELGINSVAHDSELIVVTNGDNYYPPQFLTMMTTPFLQNPAVMGTYCNFINNLYYTEARLEIGFIDCGSFMTRTRLAKEVGWKSREFGADWVFIDDIIKKVGANTMVKIPRVLFFHN